MNLEMILKMMRTLPALTAVKIHGGHELKKFT
jgi:hypothetical protein